MGRFTNLINRHISQYAHLGTEVASNGAVRTGRVQHLQESAWLHVIYPALSGDKVDRIVQLVRKRLPEALHEFYLEINGFNYLLDALIVTGLQEHARVAGAPPMPYSIEMLDVRDRPSDAARDMVFFGAYDYDLSRIYMREDDPRVFYCKADSAKPLGEWPTLYDCISSELDRLDKLCDSRGQWHDLERSPLPFGR
jgi:hypothetical protein